MYLINKYDAEDDELKSEHVMNQLEEFLVDKSLKFDSKNTECERRRNLSNLSTGTQIPQNSELKLNLKKT